MYIHKQTQAYIIYIYKLNLRMCMYTNTTLYSFNPKQNHRNLQFDEKSLHSFCFLSVSVSVSFTFTHYAGKMFMGLYLYYSLIQTRLSWFIIKNFTLHFRTIYIFSSVSQSFSPLHESTFLKFFYYFVLFSSNCLQDSLDYLNQSTSLLQIFGMYFPKRLLVY